MGRTTGDTCRFYFMASPQREDGYTAIANELLEALALVRFPGHARQVFDVVLRKTYGFNKKADRIPLTQLVAMTGVPHRSVCKALNWLKAAKIIRRDEDGLTSVNKDFDVWELSTVCEPVPKRAVPKTVAASAKNVSQPVPKRAHSKDSIQKTYSKDRDGHVDKSTGATSLIEQAKAFRSDDERWEATVAQLKALGYYARIDGDVAGFFDGGWKVKGAQGWVAYAGAIRGNLRFVKR